MIRSRWLVKFCLAVSTAALAIVSAQSAVADDITVTKAPAIPYSGTSGYNWTGFYAGGHFGVAWGSSNWTATPGISGSTSLFRTIDTFDEAGSFFAGVQAGYNYMLPNRVVIGAEIDASFPSYQNLAGISIGGTSNFTSPALGSLSYSETMLAFGTARARIGYAPGSWLFYATGGFAWTYNQQSLTQLSTGNREPPFLWQVGWQPRGVETPIAPHWTSRLEYLSRITAAVAIRSPGGCSRSVRISRCRSCAPASAISSATMRRQPTPHLWSRKRRLGRIPTTSAFTARPRSFGRGIPHSDRRIRASKVCPAAARAVRPWTSRSLPACGCGRAPGCGSIRRSIRVSVLRTRTAWPDSRRRVLQARLHLPLRSRPALFHQADDRSWRRDQKVAPTSSVRRLADGEPPGVTVRKFLSSTYSTPTNMRTVPKAIS